MSRVLRAAAAILTLASAALGAITIPTVSIPGSFAFDPDPSTGFGYVGYAYKIGATEVTNAQYTAFLNAVAATDTNDLYSTAMAGFYGGITRSGSPGSYSYATIGGRENNPVNYVSFWDACRFANWLHNGQPTGAQTNATTESGAYTITPGGIAANSITRSPAARWVVSSEDEWYRAAYHQPLSQGGIPGDYWFYTTSSNSVPTTAQANYANVIGNTTSVGSYAANFYGTFDMGGNLWEWNDAVVNVINRGTRGGAFDGGASLLQATTRLGFFPTLEENSVGFRVSQLTPPVCPGDANGDFIVDAADLSVLLGQFGSSVPPNTGADFNGDGLVNSADLSVLLSNFGVSCN